MRWITLWQCQTGLTSSEISSMAWDVYLLTAWAAAMAGVLIPESSTTSKRFPRLSIWKDFTKSFRMSHKITAYECLNTDYTLWSNTGRFFSPPSLSHQRWIVLKISLIVRMGQYMHHQNIPFAMTTAEMFIVQLEENTMLITSNQLSTEPQLIILPAMSENLFRKAWRKSSISYQNEKN